MDSEVLAEEAKKQKNSWSTAQNYGYYWLLNSQYSYTSYDFRVTSDQHSGLDRIASGSSLYGNKIAHYQRMKT